MNWENYLYPENEKPLDNLVGAYSNTSIFRTMAFVGDSLSSGEFETVGPDGQKHYYDMFEYSWGQFIARKNGLKAYNFSRGGMTTQEYCDSYGELMGFWDKEKACQAYVIALGANDTNRKDPMGSLADIDPENYENNGKTFVGYYGKIIQRYKEISPDAKFFLVGFPNPVNELRVECNAAIKAMAEYFENAYYIDLYNYGPSYDDRFREHFYLHGHLSPSGYILTANLVDSYIDYIIRHNPEDFRNAGFINTDIETYKLL